MERLFVIVGRINNVLLLLVLLSAAGSIVWMTAESHQFQHRGAVEVSDVEAGHKKSVLLNFEKVENIAGANAQLMRLTAQEKSAKFSSGGYGGETRNVLFLTGSEKSARWLFKEHKNLVLVTAQLSEESLSTKENVTRALYFEYVSEDTNHDDILSAADHSNVGLTKPDGTAFMEVLHDVSRILSYEMLDQQHLSVVYQKGPTVRHAKFSVVTLKLETDQEIVNVPSTL
ncbi:MAG: hypothetical protein JWL63_3059 [Rhodocyclales bacterium]|nr:hypothetical protein [Rhodocyclales bacterium]